MSINEERLPLSKLSCFAMAEEEGKAWFARSQANGLYEFDKAENCAKLLMRFSESSIDKKDLYLAIEKAGNILVLAPVFASKMVFYDLAADKAEYIELAPVENKRKINYTGNCDFIKSYKCGDSVYFFGWEYPAVLKVDVKTKQFVYLTDWVKGVEQRVKKIISTMGYISDYVVVGDYVWALCECADAVLCLDLRTDDIRVIDICSDLDVYCGICFDGSFWVTGYNESANKLLKYDGSFMLEGEIVIGSAKKDGSDYSFSFSSQEGIWIYYPIFNLGDRLLLFSVYPRHVYEFDKTSQEVRILPAFEELLEVRDERLCDLGILAPRKKENLIYFITGNDFLWNEYDFVHDAITRYEVRAESDEEFVQAKSKLMTGRIFMEEERAWDLGYNLSLSRFLAHIIYMPKVEADDMRKEERASTKIHERISKEVSSV